MDQVLEFIYANKEQGKCSFSRYCSGNGSLTDWQAYSLLLLSDKSAVARAT